MLDEYEDEKAYGSSEEKTRRKKTRLQKTDFMRVEDAGSMGPLSPEELETKRKIADRSKTPLDQMLGEEKKAAFRKAKVVYQKRLNRFLKEGVLTPRQKLIYELIYVRKLSGPEVAKKLGIRLATVRSLHRRVREALIRVRIKQTENRTLRKQALFLKLTKYQKLILRLYGEQGLSVPEIAVKFGRAESVIYRAIKRISKKLFCKGKGSESVHAPS